MPASYRPIVVPAHERGAIAIIAALMMTGLFILALSGFAVASLTIERRKTQNAVDAVALELADEMILKPNQNWQYAPASVLNYYLTNNGQDGSSFAAPTITTPTYNYGFATYSAGSAGADNVRDAWIPASVQVRASITPHTALQKMLESFSSILPSGASPTQTSYNVDANASIAQLQLSSFTVSRARAMLLLDFSPSMRLAYAGHEDDPRNYSGLNVIKFSAYQMMGFMYQQFNYSVRTFGYTTNLISDALSYSTTQETQPPWSEAVAHNGAAINAFVAAGSIGNAQNNGTDMITPIEQAVAELTSNNDYLAGAPILIVVSDGEPDQTSSTPCTGTLQYCNKLAAGATETAMTQAVQTPLKGEAVESFTYLINRANANLQAEDQAFMQAIATDPNHIPNGNPNNASIDDVPIDYAPMAQFILSLPIKTYCMSEPIDQLTNKKPGQFDLPAQGQAIQGFYTLGNYPGGNPAAHQDTYQVTQAMSYAEFFQSLPSYPRIDPASPMNPTATTIGHIHDALNAPELSLGKFFYDPALKVVWLNPWLCFNMTYYQDPAGSPSPARFRMRWGRPSLGPSSVDPLSAH